MYLIMYLVLYIINKNSCKSKLGFLPKVKNQVFVKIENYRSILLQIKVNNFKLNFSVNKKYF